MSYGWAGYWRSKFFMKILCISNFYQRNIYSNMKNVLIYASLIRIFLLVFFSWRERNISFTVLLIIKREARTICLVSLYRLLATARVKIKTTLSRSKHPAIKKIRLKPWIPNTNHHLNSVMRSHFNHSMRLPPSLLIIIKLTEKCVIKTWL